MSISLPHDEPANASDSQAAAAPKLRADYQRIARQYGDKRTGDRITAHYVLERRLSESVRHSTRTDRENGLYDRLYGSLLGELHDHPRNTAVAASDAETEAYVERQARMILREVGADDVFMELGGGDCKVALKVAPHVTKSIVVDVSDSLVPANPGAANFSFVKTPGVAIPLPDASVSFIYSNQVMEHLHPEDATDQLRELYRVLKPGGRYLCRTPSSISGPHDVSKYFDAVACGTHMREHSYASLNRAFRDAGFARTSIVIAPRAHRLFDMPLWAGFAIESVFAAIPRSLHTPLCRNAVARTLLGVTMIGYKA